MGHEADESSDEDDALEAKTPVAQNYYGFGPHSTPHSPEKSFTKTNSSPSSVRKGQRLSKDSSLTSIKDQGNAALNLSAPFGDPLTKWNVSKQNLLVFGPSNFDKNKGTFEHEDTQSVSTVSGSGMDFFRKFVQRKGPKNLPTPPENAANEQDCKECESQFRREVLIDRLVADALKDQAGKQDSSVSSDKGTIILGYVIEISDFNFIGN